MKLKLAAALCGAAAVLSAQDQRDPQPVRVGRFDTVRIFQKAATKSSGSVASLAQAFTSNVTAGDSVIVACGVGNSTAPTVSDTRSSTYTQAVFQANGSAFGLGIFYALLSSSGSNTVTCTNGGASASMAIQIWEVVGAVRFSSELQSKTNSGSGTGTSLSSGAIIPWTPGEYAFAAFGVGTAAQTITVTGSFTNDSGQQNPTTPAGLFSFAAASRFLNDNDSTTATATITSEPWAAAVATFRPYVVAVGAAATVIDAGGNARGANVNASNQLTVSVDNTAAVNVAQIAGATTLTGNGVTGTGSPRVTIVSDNSAVSGMGVGATGSAPPANANYIGGITSGATAGLLGGFTVCDQWAGVSQTGNTQIITGVSGRKIYICSINVVTATAQNVAVVSGTGSVCATGTTSVPGLGGGTTAATGWNFAANSGIVVANMQPVGRTTNNADNLCILQSGSGQLSGGINYAIY